MTYKSHKSYKLHKSHKQTGKCHSSDFFEKRLIAIGESGCGRSPIAWGRYQLPLTVVNQRQVNRRFATDRVAIKLTTVNGS
jgi:hypothetical protein